MIVLAVILSTKTAEAQKDSINPNGYNVFYYPNGFKLSEGYLKAGKPDGYWITYYVNGKKKSEGNRKNFLLDSLWIFYAVNGDTTETIYYIQNKKNGFDTKYYTRFDSVKVNRIKSKELYINDKREGFSFYYYPNGKLHYKIKYKNNYKHGPGFEYSKDGRLIAIDQYRYNNLISRRAVNRYDKDGKKTGLWVETFDNGKIKNQINFVQGIPNGEYKEFSPSGRLIKIERYDNGKLVSKSDKADTLNVKKLRVKREYYPNGKLKSIETFRDSVLYGVQLYCNKNGKFYRAEVYDQVGKLTAEGGIDSTKQKQGQWKYFFDDGSIEALGNFKNNLKDGKWIYYYRNGKIFEKGKYVQNLPDGRWLWYYDNGNLLREENYSLGDKQGLSFELTISGDTVARGKYNQNAKDGKWYYQIGDEYQTGQYYLGEKTGKWKVYYYPKMRLECETNYSGGKRNGKHKCFYINKKLKETGQYLNDLKQGEWYYYRDDGTLDYYAEYNMGILVKVNGLKIH
jgi:antitoxin component YwqK of YwqJK toxin-antitoxin module